MLLVALPPAPVRALVLALALVLVLVLALVLVLVLALALALLMLLTLRKVRQPGPSRTRCHDFRSGEFFSARADCKLTLALNKISATTCAPHRRARPRARLRWDDR